MRLPTLLLALFAASPILASQKPEIERPVAPPQNIGQLHALRVIPEACRRLQGRFNGQGQTPAYAMEAVRSQAGCRPRALFGMATSSAGPSENGWLLHDVIRIPNASCPSQLAVLRIWRHPGNIQTPKVDVYGRSRIYLQDAMQDPAQNVPRYAAHMQVEGECR